MTDRITINPITRLEGHGKIEIFLNDQGEVADAFWQVTELRGFERFCLGRPAEEMTRIVANICGVCPSAHHMAATKALDELFGVEPTPTAKLIRQLEYNAAYLEDHYLHFFFLAAPDFLVGPEADPAQRNILGVLARVGREIGLKVIEVRKKNRDITRHIFSKAPHPEGGLPGGVPRRITEEDRKWIKETADQSLQFAIFAIQLFKDAVLADSGNLSLIMDKAYSLQTYYMALVDEEKRAAFYNGHVRIVTPNGREFAIFAPKDYADYIAEWVEPWTYIRLNYLKKIGWNGLTEGEGTSLYRVAPLARLNASQGMLTPLAQNEYELMFNTLGSKPAHHTLAMHWARLICALQAAEHNCMIANDPLLTSRDIRNMNFKKRNVGVGCVEAPRGTLIHHYEMDSQGLLTKINLIVATQNNAAPICLSIKKAAQAFIKGGEVHEGLLNKVEMAFRAYDPCLGCATHAGPDQGLLTINVRNQGGEIITTIKRAGTT
ncbi:MAG: Ni/Fe hydrogenase subunit alpha [Deltaproteobacteria bacterium]|nr:Ni/Fe hydrogenase subunit alpha [Deltaproteobacteria bacterium]